ncbi:ergothioneine biosynthesis protein EgtB [Alcanivorax sp. JB21]|nr:ergothioneine biosynthesis protein EgtB [Alcanivorax limicola]
MSTDDAAALLTRYRHVRDASLVHCASLQTEDFGLQAVPETSPAKWHLAHTAWFFETFLLRPFLQGYTEYNAGYAYLFNSYYNGVGAQFPRAERGLLSRPTVEEVIRYRAHVDHAMAQLLNQQDHRDIAVILSRTRLGLHHEYQHQELLFTDLKYNFHCNPLLPAWQPATLPVSDTQTPQTWHRFAGGLSHLGVDEEPDQFCFDNETPRHQTLLQPFRLATRPLCNAEVLAFIEDGGYRNPALWLADGWARVQEGRWQHPLYWQQDAHGAWHNFTLHGLQPLDPAATACHLSAYEADALARWAGARLPTEAEWEHAANSQLAARSPAASPALSGHFLDQGMRHPTAAAADTGPLQQLFGSVWEWTANSYSPYPGYRPAAGAIGEYNGKFMCNQLVLRGGSCVSARQHIRPSYRNFFYPGDRWQFSGVRLARDDRPETAR